MLDGEAGAPKDVVTINAAAALVAAGMAADLPTGATLAAEAIRSGKAREKLAALVDFTNQ